MRNVRLLALALMALCIPFACQKDTVETPQAPVAEDWAAIERGATILPAGSVNQLAAALQVSSTVILEPGLHIESDPVVVSGYHHIIGRPGAILRMGSAAALDLTVPIEVALHFKNAGNSSIQGVKMEPIEPIGGTAILIENSQKASVQRCEITGFQFGIVVEKSPLCNITSNKVAVSSAWLTGDIPQAHGIVVVNGAGVAIEKNEVSGGFFGIWPCDKNGVCRDNYTHDNYVGIILCKVPTGGLSLPDGSPIGAAFACQGWTVRHNRSMNNLNIGYLVIDGANNNFVTQNEADGNGLYDYELTGDTYRFGFLAPASFENRVIVGEGDTVKDCGNNNVVTGGVQINTTLDPCN